MQRWRCSICGYIHTGIEPPESCVACGAPKDAFEEYPAYSPTPHHFRLFLTTVDRIPNFHPPTNTV